MIEIARIQALVCAKYSISREVLIGRRNERCIARPRQVAMWLARRTTSQSFPAIGRHFGERDHTTVMHAVKVVDGLIVRGDRYGRDVLALLHRLPRDAP